MSDSQSFDMSALLRQAQEMSEQIMARQAEAASATHEGRAGGGAVRVVVTGDFEFRSVHIDPGVVDPSDVTLLEDLVLAALRDAVARVGESQEPALDLGSLDLGALGNFLGGG